jgi:hypothetical protein
VLTSRLSPTRFFVLSSQVLRGMDLYVGAGGLGYLDHVSLLPDGTPDPDGWAHAAAAHLPRLPSPSRRRLPDMLKLLRCPPTDTFPLARGVPAAAKQT